MEFSQKSPMEFPRHGHAANAFSGTHIVVTGSRKDTNLACQRAEIYDIEKNTWLRLGNMINGRHYHSSCTLDNEYVYVFCGIKNSTKKYFSSIERVNVRKSLQNLVVPWEEIQVTNPSGAAAVLPPRQGLGTVQSDSDSIMIIGGFGGRFFTDSWVLNTKTNVLQLTQKQLDRECFAF